VETCEECYTLLQYIINLSPDNVRTAFGRLDGPPIGDYAGGINTSWAPFEL